jgi:hypothetical protein
MQKLSLFVLVAAVGCGGGKKDPVVLPDSAPDVDAPPTANCLIPANAGTVIPPGQAAIHSNPAEEYVYFALMGDEALPDVFQIELYSGFGAFAGGFPAGPTTIQLNGVEAQYRDCGACVRVFTDVNLDTGESADGDTSYMATGGTLTLEAISEAQLKGSVSNVTFTHVNIAADFTSTPHPDGCSGNLGSLEFDIDPMPADSKPNQNRGGAFRATNLRWVP